MKWMPWLSRDLKKGGRKTVEKLGIALIVAFVAPPSRMFLATLSKNTLIFRYNVRSALPRTLAETSWKLTWKASMACLFEHSAIKKTKVTLKFVQTLTWRSFRRCAQFAVRWENWFGSVVSVIIVTSRKPTHSGMWKQSMLFANTSAPSAISQIVAEMLWSNTW